MGPSMPDAETIRTIEIAAARAWPATETAAVDGWLLRRTPTVQRARSNAALPPPRPDVGPEALDAVTAWYRDRSATPQVQVSPLEWHAELDAALAARGWTTAHGADVLVAPAGDVLAVGDGAAEAVLDATPTADWLATWGRCEGRSAASCAAHARAILAPVVPRATFARLPGAVGLCVRDPGIAGIFCMATDPAQRRRGLAGRLLRTLAADAIAHGAERLYLQVDSRNDEAAGLYGAHGFVKSHGYAFRVAPERA